MSLSESDFLDDQIRNNVSIDLPPDIDRRLRGQLAEFRSRLEAATPQRAAMSIAPDWTRRGWVLGTVAAAAAALVSMAIMLWPRDSFAEVVAAVLNQAWVHVRVMEADQCIYELWFSPTKNVLALRQPGSIEFEDYRLQVYDSYDPNARVLYHGPVVWRSKATGFDSLAAAMTVLLQDERTIEKPLAHLDFLGPERAKMRVLDQRVEKVSEQGHAWLDYRLTVNSPRSTLPIRMFFRVDAVTKLPQLCRVESRRDDKAAIVERRFDFPQNGPADIYDLGVPKATKLVDRVPAGDLKRILETLRADRVRMDDYRAVFVMQLDMDYVWWAELPNIFYRKGARFRADYCGGSIGDLPAVKRPAEGLDLDKWWLERTKLFRFYPGYVLRDSTLYSSITKSVTDRDGSQHQDIVSVQRTNFGNNPDEIYPADYSMRPEFACRPPLGIGDPHMEPTLDMHPTEGPAGCILLDVWHTRTKDRINEKGIGIPDGTRYWLDPERDYIVMRCDLISATRRGKRMSTSAT